MCLKLNATLSFSLHYNYLGCYCMHLIRLPLNNLDSIVKAINLVDIKALPVIWYASIIRVHLLHTVNGIVYVYFGKLGSPSKQ